MSVDLHPEELGFRRPFTHEVTQVLSIRNDDARPIAFKVKTTAPKQYCVRPNSGVVRPHESVDVQVLLQAMKEDPPLDARCRDKFLVQSVSIDEVPHDDNLAATWSQIEKTHKSSIQERKIRVQFLPAGGAMSSLSSNGVKSENPPPAYASSPAQNYNSPSPPSMLSSQTHAVPVDTPSRSVNERSAFSSSAASPPTTNTSTSAQAQQTKEKAVSGVQSVTQAVIDAVPKSADDVQQQLAAAQAKISELTNQLADPQIRQRKIQETKESVQHVIQQTQDTGVPLQICAGLCFLSFLIAYLFF